MKTLGVVTATRAEYGLLRPVIREFRSREDAGFRMELIVTGTHLSDAYGMTVREITERIDHRISVPVDCADERDIAADQAQTLIAFTELFMKERYDAVMLLGDRYELLSVAIAAANTGTPIFHLCGGDTTEGAMDEWIRHSITKMSYLHFVTSEESRKRVIRLGEDPERVFDYGSTSLDNVREYADMSRADALESAGLPDLPYALCTYHPVTMEKTGPDGQMQVLFEVIKAYPSMLFVFTKSNADQGGDRINSMLDEAAERIPNLRVFASLGVRRYLSLMRYAEFVLGNSSSGIIEAPMLHVPTVNIGDRQKGRLQAASIINCEPTENAVNSAIEKALSRDFRDRCRDVVSPYGEGHPAEKIADRTLKVLMNESIDLKKAFYDLSETEVFRSG